MWKQYKSNFISISKKIFLLFISLHSHTQAYSHGSLEAEHLHNTIKEILEILPNEFNLRRINEKYPISNKNSLNFVLRQEVRQYNQLLQCIRSDTIQVLDAIQGNFYFLFFLNITTATSTAFFILNQTNLQ